MSGQHRSRSLRVRDLTLRWGARTYLMGIVNLTPDSFSGDGLSRADIDTVLAHCHRMVDEGADLLDLGAESTRPGHAVVDEAEETARLIPVLARVREAFPGVPISVDTRKAAVAIRSLDAGADILNDVAGVTGDGALAAVAAERGAPYVLMHDRRIPTTGEIVPRVIDDLRAAVGRAIALGCDPATIIVDPGIGFGKDASGNLALLQGLTRLRVLDRPVLLGASRKSTIGRVLDLPPDDRLEGTLATTVLGVVGGVDIVRVHDVRPNLRAARMADAVVRGWHDPDIEGAT
jgi:dihydropteroate synthase